MDAYQQRPEAAAVVVQPPMTTSCPARHLALVQVSASAGAIGRVGLLRDDPLERQLAGGEQDGIAAGLEMLDVAQSGPRRSARRQQRLQPFLALGQRQRRRSSPSANSRSNAKNTRSSVFSLRERRLKRREIGRPVASSATISPSMIASGSAAQAVAIAGNLSVQSSPLRVRRVACRLRRAAAPGSRRT